MSYTKKYRKSEKEIEILLKKKINYAGLQDRQFLRFVDLYISTVPKIETYQKSNLNSEAKEFK